MSAAALVHLLVIVGVLAVLVPPTGRYLAAVYGGDGAPGDRLFDPVEHVVYRGAKDPQLLALAEAMLCASS